MKSPSWAELLMKEIEGQRRWEKYPRKLVQESMLKWYGYTCISKRRRICGQYSDGDGGAGEKNERKTELSGDG